jgi:hypothetical protein
MNRLLRYLLWSFVLCTASITARAQFTVVGPAPFSEPVARQKIRTLLEKVDPGNRQQTVETLNGWAVWYRNLIDDELIAAWQKDPRANLADLMGPLADARIASAVVEFSWRQQPEAAFNPLYAPMLGDLMERFADSAKPFLDDLLGAGQALPLSQSVAETACRILIDMPDVGTWRKDALRILPYYRRIAINLLTQDLNGGDREKEYRADMLLRELRPDGSDTGNGQPNSRRTLSRSEPSTVDRRRGVSAPDAAAPGPSVTNTSTPAPSASAPSTSAPSVSAPSAPSAPSLAPRPAASAPTPAPLPAATSAVTAMSGTLSCSGAPIPQNAEYVFRNLPPGRLQLDYDTKNWEARLMPGEGQTQKLILKNKGQGPQKRCVVHWSVSK